MTEKRGEEVEHMMDEAYLADQAWLPEDSSLMDDILFSLRQLSREDLTAVNLILSERVGQIKREGWTPEHDDHERAGVLAGAAAAFAKAAADEIQGLDPRCPAWWPWSKKWWKPYGFQRNLERSAALLIAEISRMLRTPE